VFIRPAACRIRGYAFEQKTTKRIKFYLSKSISSPWFSWFPSVKSGFMQKITPFLWFDNQAEEAVNFYVSVFKNSKIKTMTHYTGEEPSGEKGSVMTVSFELDGQELVALNGGPRFKFTEAVSFVVNCETQEEIDYYWEKLTAGGGEEVQCGWLTDKYGLSWQVVPNKWDEWGKDPAGMQRLMHALMQMKKIDIATLERAYEGK
jgi:predicted 3-demethylubiquinone-9 3-methyltransferase (glyoxalase superfamily)